VARQRPWLDERLANGGETRRDVLLRALAARPGAASGGESEDHDAVAIVEALVRKGCRECVVERQRNRWLHLRQYGCNGL
jgi:hypothetical protein